MVDRRDPESFVLRLIPGRAAAIENWREAIDIGHEIADDLAKGLTQLRTFIGEVDTTSLKVPEAQALEREKTDHTREINNQLKDVEYFEYWNPKTDTVPFMPDSARKAVHRTTEEKLEPIIESGIMLARYFLNNLENEVRERPELADERHGDIRDLEAIERHFQRAQKSLEDLQSRKTPTHAPRQR